MRCKTYAGGVVDVFVINGRYFVHWTTQNMKSEHRWSELSQEVYDLFVASPCK